MNKTCDCCDEVADDLSPEGVCEECESEYYVYCDVCSKHVRQDGRCRHVFWDDDGWGGCGYVEYDRDRNRVGVWALCRHLEKAKSLALRDALRAGTFYFQHRGPLIGRGDLYAWLGKGSGVDGHGFFRPLADAIQSGTIPDKESSLACSAVGWIVSLWSGGDDPWKDRERETREWDEKTAGWIDQWFDDVGPVLDDWGGVWVVRKDGADRVAVSRPVEGIPLPARDETTEVATVRPILGDDARGGDVILCRVDGKIDVRRVLRHEWQGGKPVLIVPTKTGDGVRRVRHTDVYGKFVRAKP